MNLSVAVAMHYSVVYNVSLNFDYFLYQVGAFPCGDDVDEI